MQKIGAFKYRGALNAVKKYHETHGDAPATFVTHSSGNHAQVGAVHYLQWHARIVRLLMA